MGQNELQRSNSMTIIKSEAPTRDIGRPYVVYNLVTIDENQ